MRRRDLLFALAGAGGVAVVVKVAGRSLLGPAPVPTPHRTRRLRHLSPRLEAVATSAAVAMVGDRGEAALAAGRWDPAADLDGLLGALAADQRRMAAFALHLLEEWTLGFQSFSRMPLAKRRLRLAAWRTSELALHRSVWGLLHAAFGGSFARSADGWEIMGYLGPCLASEGHRGRPPGQTVDYVWDEVVP